MRINSQNTKTKITAIRSRIAQYCSLRDMTQEDLARQVGTSRQTLARHIANPDDITIGELHRICAVLRMATSDTIDLYGTLLSINLAQEKER